MTTDLLAELGLRIPGTVEELNVPRGMLEDLFVRRLLISRSATILSISEALAISPAVGRDLADELRDRKEIEYLGLEGRDYKIGLTSNGEANARERSKSSTYSGSAPVSLEDYTRVILAQKSEMVLNRESIRVAFGDLVVADELLDQLGPAFLSDGAIFLYGPPGTGKTSLAERMIKLHKDTVVVPRAVEVDGQVIMVHDPSVHTEVEHQPEGMDSRWVLCQRPLVIVGGELSPQMLDLQYDQVSGVYTAPIQMQANNGILVVDDFGRQQMSPTEVLNRWIVPLSRGIDFLRLINGVKFTIPFELKLVASTNLDPNDLGDDAFLRRLRNKVYVGPITDNAFNWILVRVAKAKGIEVSADDAAHLRAVAKRYLGELRPYVAVDFCDLMLGVCDYEGIPKKLDTAMIDRVASVYFLQDPAELEPDAPIRHHPAPPAQSVPATDAPQPAAPVPGQSTPGHPSSAPQPAPVMPQPRFG